MNNLNDNFLNECKTAEYIICNSIFYIDYGLSSIIVNNYLIDKEINYKKFKFVINLYFHIVRNISLIKKIINNIKLINHKSIILEYELKNLYNDYNKISKYKNNFIINMAFLSNSNKVDENIFKILHYCNTKYLDNIMEHLP